MTKRPDEHRRLKQLRTGAERLAVREARTLALLVASRLGCGDVTCRDLQEAREALDQACEKVEGLLFDPAWGRDQSTEAWEAVLA